MPMPQTAGPRVQPAAGSLAALSPARGVEPLATVARPTQVRSSPTTGVLSNHDCPLFLRKTFHMIDTCDPQVASWSEDDETFVVRNPDVFEKSIIPQFFKHSKFSSFVRQLNFYGFRKIKYTDTIRIDHKLEAETANFWKFHHENFRRGRPDLLIQIKRHGGKEKGKENGVQVPAASGGSPEKVENVKGVKSEVAVLRERIAVMTKSIDDLTAIVQKMAVKEGNDRKRVKVEEVTSESSLMGIPNIESGESIANDVSFTPVSMFPSPVSSRQSSLTSEMSDQEFVGDLFDVLDDDSLNDLVEDPVVSSCEPLPPVTSSCSQVIDHEVSTGKNRPSPQLMNELGDALSTLPHGMQEMLVRRLISSITKTQSVKGHIEAAAALSKVPRETSKQKEATPVPASPVARSIPRSPSPVGSLLEVPLPLAAATLNAFLAQYTANSRNICGPRESCSLPVIPVHA